MIYQWTYRNIIAIHEDGLINKLVVKMLRILRRTLALLCNPLVKMRIWNSEMLLPFTHGLPTILKEYPRYNSNLLTIARQTRDKYPSLSMIDVGGNVGDTIALIRQEEQIPILSIEGDEYFFSILQKNAALFRNVSLEKSFVGDAGMRGVVMKERGTAHIVQDANVDERLSFKTLNEIIRSHPTFTKSKLLKIDTDGFDGIVIRGAKDYLAAAKPVIFFEYDPYYLAKQNDDGISIFASLQEAGYQCMIVYDNLGNYLQGIDLNDVATIKRIHNEFTGFGGGRYCDIAVFNVEDKDLFDTLNNIEKQNLLRH